jgi:hypothetical protein
MLQNSDVGEVVTLSLSLFVENAGYDYVETRVWWEVTENEQCRSLIDTNRNLFSVYSI